MRFPSSGWSAARDTALLSMLLVCLVPLAAFGQPNDDGYLAGYVARRPRATAQCQPALPHGQGWRRDHRRGRRAPRRSAQDHDGDHGGPGRDPRRDPRGRPAVTVGAGRDGARRDLRAGDGVPGDRFSADGSPLPAAHRRSALAPVLGLVPVLHHHAGAEERGRRQLRREHPDLPRQSRRQGQVGAVGGRAAGRRLLDLRPRLGLLRPHQYRLPRRGLRQLPLRGLLGHRPDLSPELSPGRRAAPERHPSQSHQPEL